ncbi:hypothetical protein A2316_02030 [Candidatus Falkowbacteria bacterium RIFOXYB2_FULL_38_15]|uniref:DUF5667 domain-containing protein n=1 Tax=Candidatus Falkowbacteria bacterium RIFOXYA2_FULL_38_12 TaxID=1797993 RepID=A0A1F5S404_9BACT|nr:MAG: hypothetical protein A2257_00765 [Candidatus Falkowbacteria bacterium RIFOXYA2_FULL_38_12]OGF33274.1 MAG: hypothetical protein A2316_02030 [Candidatus Falkowbacteria bacterium RIFOXYB2_FULL_38_15]OGF42351.1 MAG: hypothetical protein A2555_00165 [Candidatus Falkowbacteria bacterium RIFOXYD2_FULL_39_16]
MKIHKIKKKLENLSRIKISGENKLAENRAVLLEFAEQHPVRKNEINRQIITRGKFLQLTIKPMPILVGIVIAALLTGGGTAYASQSSLPGDALYPVKLAVEEVETAVSLGQDKKADLDVRFANRRMEEIQKLQEKLKNKNGEMKLEVIEKAMERAENKLEKAEARIAEMEAGELKEKALATAARLEEALQKHEQLLSDLAGELPDKAEQVLLRAETKTALRSEKALGTILRLEKREELKDKAKEQVGKIMGAEERAEGKIKALENKIEASQKYLENMKEQGRDVVKYEAKLAEARAKLVESKEMLEEKKYLESFQAANQAMKMLIEAKIMSRPVLPPKVKNFDEEKGDKSSKGKDPKVSLLINLSATN